MSVLSILTKHDTNSIVKKKKKNEFSISYIGAVIFDDLYPEM